MAKSKKAKKIKEFIEAGNFKNIKEVFEMAPPTPVANYLGLNPDRFKKKLAKPQEFRLRELYSIATYFEVAEDLILQLAHGQYMGMKMKPKKDKTINKLS